MELKTHEQVVYHLRDLRDILIRKHGWSLQRIADGVQIAKHTLSQYCQLPGTKGARRPHPMVLDFCRSTIIELDRARWDKYFPEYLGREAKAWFVLNPDMSTALETHSLFAASMYAAPFEGMLITPGPDNTNPDEQLSDDQRLCVECRQITESGLVSREDVVEITGVGEYEIHLLGCERLAWRIQPTQEQVRALRQRARENFAERYPNAA